MSLLHDPFGRAGIPRDFDRAGRVRLIAEVAAALLDGRDPGRVAALFVGGALEAWLQEGGRVGDLERVFLKVAAPERSRLTPGRLWERECCAATATGTEERRTMDPPPAKDLPKT
jgi:hypothetical protein